MLKRYVFFSCKIFMQLSLFISLNSFAHLFITNNTGGSQLGDCAISFAIAKILSLKYPDKLKVLHYPFRHSDLFKFDETEQRFNLDANKYKRVYIDNENDLEQYLNQNDVYLVTHIGTRIGHIEKSWIDATKNALQLKAVPLVNEIPTDIITIAIHIRKGNGGGEIYDGELSSMQYYSFDRNKVAYVCGFNGYPFDWEYYRYLDQAQVLQTKFPPEQYYADQIKKISLELNNCPLYVQVFTDDKEPWALFNRIKNEINLQNITFNYVDNRNFSFRERIAQDIHSISRFDVFIRSQSFFARAIELISSHKVIIHPLESRWEGKKLIMSKIAIKGNIQDLKDIKSFSY